MPANSASEATMPVGLCGELTISALVFGVTARRRPSTSIAKPRPSCVSGTARRSQPAIAMTGEYES